MKQFEFEQSVRFAFAGIMNDLRGLKDGQFDSHTLLTQILEEVHIMSQGISDLNASISALAGQDTSLQNALAAVSADIISVVTSIKSQLAAVSGSAPTVDLTNQIASLTKIGTDLGVVASNLTSLQTQVDAAGNPIPGAVQPANATGTPPSTVTTSGTVLPTTSASSFPASH